MAKCVRFFITFYLMDISKAKFTKAKNPNKNQLLNLEL